MSKEINKKGNLPTKTWSKETCRYTEDALRNLEFGWNPITGQVMMKKINGTFGHIKMSDALNNIYKIEREDGEVEIFSTARELTKAGWALD